MEAGSPKEKSQGLEKGLEVVVLIYGSFVIEFDVSKHLRHQERRLLKAPTQSVKLAATTVPPTTAGQ